MKKKNVLMMAMSLVMVAVIAVGGTLAYMSDKTDVVTNTFTTSANIKMNLTEQEFKDGVATGVRTQTGSSYKDVLPGVEYTKDPAVQMTSVPAGGAYVFMAVSGLGTTEEGFTATAAFNSDNWKKITTGDGQDGLYVYVADGKAETIDNAQSGETRMPALFNNVSFEFDNEAAEGKPADIKVVAFAAQAENTVFSTVAQDALTTLNKALTETYQLDNGEVTAVTPVSAAA